MQDPIDKTAALVQAHEYIRCFAGKVIVVKIGGSTMDEADTLSNVLSDVCFMAAVGMCPIVVHGGGKEITAAMQKAGLKARFLQGRRYTDEQTLVLAEQVLVNQVNSRINQIISKLGHKAMGLHSLSSCVVFAKRLRLDQECGPQLDLGFVGEVEWVNAELLHALTETGCIPVIAPIARDAAGGKLNVNADLIGGHVAAATRAEKLVLVSDTHGIRRSNEEDDLASHLTKDDVKKLVELGVIRSGMLPKVEACLLALEAGVPKAHIVDGRIPHSVLLEVYTDKGIGTEIVL